jgi:hypothetical protein
VGAAALGVVAVVVYEVALDVGLPRYELRASRLLLGGVVFGAVAASAFVVRRWFTPESDETSGTGRHAQRSHRSFESSG